LEFIDILIIIQIPDFTLWVKKSIII
jgi:hypothetical protein